LKPARRSAPFLTVTCSAFHKVKAVAGAPEYARHDEQWQ
jgi:hypothetical protein